MGTAAVSTTERNFSSLLVSCSCARSFFFPRSLAESDELFGAFVRLIWLPCLREPALPDASARDAVLALFLGFALRRDLGTDWPTFFALIAADRFGERFRRRVAGLMDLLMDGRRTRRRFGIAALLGPRGQLSMAPSHAQSRPAGDYTLHRSLLVYEQTRAPASVRRARPECRRVAGPTGPRESRQ